MTGCCVDVFAVTGFDDKDDEGVVFDCTDDAVVSNAIAPETCEIAGESFSAASRVIKCRYLFERVPDTACYLFVELA